jgi:DnaB-like helicase N terminal domain
LRDPFFVLPVARQLTPGDFAPRLRPIYEAILALLKHHEPLDPLTVSEALCKRGQLDGLGGAGYLWALRQQAVETPALARQALQRLRRASRPGLSRLQKDILRDVWEETVRVERVLETKGMTGLLARVQYWGIEWYPSRGHDRWTPTDRAVVSRALRRLEQRGLVERKNECTGQPGRTTNVRLTERGREIAKQLTFSSRKMLAVAEEP